MGTAGHLTEKAIKGLRPRPGVQYVVWDEAVPGFGVRVSPMGTKTFVLKFRTVNRRQRWKTIGRVDTLALEKARKLARSDIGLVSAGSDPLMARDLAKGSPTVASVAARFLEEHVEARRKPATLRLYRLAIDSHITPTLGTLLIRDITTADVVRLHHRLRATPYLANRTLAVLSKLVAWAEQRGYRPAGVNPARGVEKYREEPRRRYLTAEEMKRLGTALRTAEKEGAVPPAAIVAIKLLILTGARVGEVLSLKWAYVDRRRGVLRLPDSKTGAKEIMLSAPALEVLQHWPRQVGSAYVFPATGRSPKRRGTHRTTVVDAWTWLRKKARLGDVRLHDLRHSYASVAVGQGQSLPVIGGLLGHTQPATTARYAHLQTDPLRAAAERTAGVIDAALGGGSR